MNETEPKDKNTAQRDAHSVEGLLIEASRILNMNLELDALLKNILDILTRYLEAQASAILLFNFEDGRTVLFTFNAGRGEVNRLYIPADDKGVGALVVGNNKPVIINKFSENDQLKATVDERFRIATRNLMAAPIIRKDKLVGVIEVVNKNEGKDFDEQDLEIMNALGDQIALAVANAKLIIRARRKSTEAESLYEVGKLMSGTLVLEELLKLMVDQVSRLVKVDVATIYIVDPEDHSIKEIVSKGIDKDYEHKLILKIGQGICGWVAKTGESVLLNDVSESKQYLRVRPEVKSEIAVPLISRGKVIGVFNVESDQLGAYSQADLELLQTFGSQAAVSIERAMLYQQAMQRKILEDELVIARRIQQTFLPKANPRVAGFDIAGVNIPSEAVGGDYYDFIDIVKNQVGIAVGDASGKGIGAALIMAAFRASLRAEIRNNYAIRTILSKVNSLLYESIERENYVTAVYGVLDSKNRVFTFANAGHNPPLWFRSAGEVIELAEGGMALGMFPNSLYDEIPIYLNPEDVLLFYTDGVTEAQNGADEEFGTARLKALVKESGKASATEIINRVVESVLAFKDPGKPLDDLTMVLVKCLESA